MPKYGRMTMLAWYIDYDAGKAVARMGYIADSKLLEAEVAPEVVSERTGKVLRPARVIRPAETGYRIEWMPGGRVVPPIGNTTKGVQWVRESELSKYEQTSQLKVTVQR